MSETNNQTKKIYIGRVKRLPKIFNSNIPSAPTSVQVAITEACPMRCIHCDLWQTQRQHEELSSEKWIEVIDELAEWLPHRLLHFTGGEPFCRKDFLTLVSYAAHTRKMIVSCNTSGILIRKSDIEEIKEAGFNGLIFSIDALDELHGKIRGNKEVFERNLKWIEILRHHMYITIASVIMSKNLHQLSDLVRFAVKVGAAGIGFQPLFQNFGAQPLLDWYKTSPLWPKNYREVENVIDELIVMARQNFPILNTIRHLNLMKEYFYSPMEIHKHRCLVGETNLAISPYGEVRLCYQMPPIGNVKMDSLRSLWIGESAAEQRHIINNCHRSCGIMNCNYNEI